jgi:tRNA-binding EMAP/Myf-like protein
MSIHEVLVVEIEKVEKHPNADALELIKVSGYDYSIVSKIGDFKVGDLGIFIEPDYVVPTTNQVFAFLKKGNKDTQRITVRRLRGIWSEGLLIKAESHHKVGDNVMEEYGITRWEPPPSKSFGWGAEGAALKSGLQTKEPVIPGVIRIPHYSLENYKKHTNLLTEEDMVYYTTKIHGCLFFDTLLETNIGPKTIGEIVDNKLNVLVKSFNHDTNQIEFKKITNHMSSYDPSDNNWFEIELEDNRKIKITGNHKVFLPKLNCYRAVQDLKEDDEFLVD